MIPVSAAVRSDLAPRGTLRVGLNLANFLLVTKDPASGEPRGVAVDLAQELGRRAGVAVEFVGFESPGIMADAAGAWDIGFLAAEPSRGDVFEFTPAYLEVEATYLVPAGSALRAIDEVDRDGVRICVYEKSAYDLYLSRSLKHARLVRAGSIGASYERFVAEKLEALAGLRPRLVVDAEKLPGSRVLEGRFTAIQQAICLPKGHDAAAGYLREFVEDIKAKGVVAQAIKRHGVRGVTVAPRSPIQ
jgi:polar amino acid transport system substrate-binding protein